MSDLLAPSRFELDVDEFANEVTAAARRLAGRGRCDATSSNFSARLPSGLILITRSGADKAVLEPDDFIVVDERGKVLLPAGSKSSAETDLHLMIYDTRPEARAVLHTHSVAATVLSLEVGGGNDVVLEGYEMLKALDGVTSHEHVEHVPVVANGQDMRSLAGEAKARLAALPNPHGFLLAGHGLYTWGRSVADALRQAEGLEFLFECVLARARLR